jgi:signal transduction histidine kinase
VVSIGASAGGLDAFKKLFAAIPPDSGIAFVLMPHLDPRHESLVAELIGRHTAMPVAEAVEGMAVEPNHVYIIPPNKYMTIRAGVLRLTGGVLETAAREQNRIGQELHDSVGQELTGLGLMAGALAQKLTAQAPAEAELAAKIAAGVERTHQQVRNLSFGLAPVELDPEGLRAALEELAARTRDQTGTACTFEAVGQIHVDDAVTATHLFLIGQEAVNNALRHGRAQSICLTLHGDRRALTLTIADDGVGIPVPLNEQKGLGIRLMRYRAGLVGGTLTIEPAAKGGSRVTCIVARQLRDDQHHAEEEAGSSAGRR